MSLASDTKFISRCIVSLQNIGRWIWRCGCRRRDIFGDTGSCRFKRFWRYRFGNNVYLSQLAIFLTGNLMFLTGVALLTSVEEGFLLTRTFLVRATFSVGNLGAEVWSLTAVKFLPLQAFARWFDEIEPFRFLASEASPLWCGKTEPFCSLHLEARVLLAFSKVTSSRVSDLFSRLFCANDVCLVILVGARSNGPSWIGRSTIMGVFFFNGILINLKNKEKKSQVYQTQPP